MKHHGCALPILEQSIPTRTNRVRVLSLLVLIVAGCSTNESKPIDVCDVAAEHVSGTPVTVSGILSTDGFHHSALMGRSCGTGISLLLERDLKSSEIVALRGTEFLTVVFSDVHSGVFREYEVVARGSLRAAGKRGELQLIATEIVSYEPVSH